MIQDLCEKIRKRIFEATKLTCSCGIAPNKMLAKISSDINKVLFIKKKKLIKIKKPNGQFYLNREK